MTWVTFAEGESVKLDEGATFMILHADGTTRPKRENENSTVVLLTLGERTLLLTGDAESSKTRTDPDIGGIEQHLVDTYGAKLHVDILQVGHHGSLTSTRKAFLDVVKPSMAIVSSGPMKYGPVTLPDKDVLKRLRDQGAVLVETYEHDKKCPEADHGGIDDPPPPKKARPRRLRQLRDRYRPDVRSRPSVSTHSGDGRAPEDR